MAHRRTSSQRGLTMKHHSAQNPLLSPVPASPAFSTDGFDLPSKPEAPAMSPPATPLKPGFRSYDEGSWPMRSGLSLPKQVHRHTTYLALLALAALSTFIFLVSQPNLPLALTTMRPTASSANTTMSAGTAAIPADTVHQAGQPAHEHDGSRGSSWRKASGKARGPQLKLDAHEELAAVTAFMAALAENLIPPRLDPMRPLDPDVVLDFDTRGPRAREELDELVRDTWTRNPVVLFTKVCFWPLARCKRTCS
jgi:hypothetical protein